METNESMGSVTGVPMTRFDKVDFAILLAMGLFVAMCFYLASQPIAILPYGAERTP